MKQAFHIVNQHIKQNCLVHIQSLDESAGMVVTIASEQETRSKAQHRLKWVWMGQLARELAGVGLGRDSEQWNNHFKVRLMPSILLEQNEDTHDLVNRLRKTWKLLKNAGEDELSCDQIIGGVLKTEDLTVKSMTTFMSKMDAIALERYGVKLITPDDLRWAVA